MWTLFFLDPPLAVSIGETRPLRHAGPGLGYETSASYVEMQCGSAIDSINHGAWKILANQADVIIVGGMESYSQMAIKFSMATPAFKLIPPMPIPGSCPRLKKSASVWVSRLKTFRSSMTSPVRHRMNSPTTARCGPRPPWKPGILKMKSFLSRSLPHGKHPNIFQGGRAPPTEFNPGGHGQTATGFQNGRHRHSRQFIGSE